MLKFRLARRHSSSRTAAQIIDDKRGLEPTAVEASSGLKQVENVDLVPDVHGLSISLPGEMPFDDFAHKAFREANVHSITSPASAFDFPTSPPFPTPLTSCSMPSKTVEWNRVVHYRVIPGVCDYSQEEWNSLWWSLDELSHIKNRESHRRALVRSLTKLRLIFDLQDDSYITVSKR